MWKISDENRDDGEKRRQEPAQNRQKKRSGNPKIPVWLEKTRQTASVKRKRFRIKKSEWRGRNTAGTCTKQAEKTLQEPKNTGIVEKFLSGESRQTENPFREIWILPPESPEKSGKIMDMERKISHTARKKAWKWFERWGKNTREWEAEAEKNRLFLRKKFRRSTKNTGMRWKNGRQYPQNTKDSRWKIKITGKNTAGACTKQAEKMLRELKNAEIADKKTTGDIRKM